MEMVVRAGARTEVRVLGQPVQTWRIFIMAGKKKKKKG
jgi:hypothetical protein